MKPFGQCAKALAVAGGAAAALVAVAGGAANAKAASAALTVTAAFGHFERRATPS
ncbi:hypothetical protein [Amycolatopsis sp. NPDC004378]